MKEIIDISLVEAGLKGSKARTYMFTRDPKKPSRYVLKLDIYRTIYVTVGARKRWEFWK
jgi:hypothetical protein